MIRSRCCNTEPLYLLGKGYYCNNPFCEYHKYPINVTDNESYPINVVVDIQDRQMNPNNPSDKISSFAPPYDSDKTPPLWVPDATPTTHVGAKDAEVLAQGGTQFSTGAVRSSDKASVRYDLISPIGMRRLAETMEEGRKKYGYFNWERGMPIGDILNHAIAHIYAYLEGKPTNEDDLAHAAWNLLAAMHMEETHPNIEHQVRQTVQDNILGKHEIPKDDLDKDGQVKL